MEKSGTLQLVDTAEAASLLGVSEWAVLRDCESGRLPAEYLPTQQGVEWRVLLDALRPSRSGQPSRAPSIPTGHPQSEISCRHSEGARTEESPPEFAGGREVPSCLAPEILPRLEERIAGLQTAVESLTAQVALLADESARLRDEVIRGVRLPVVSAVR